MKENMEQQKQTPASKKGMSDFRKALLWTAIPIVVLSVASMAGVIVNSGDEGAEFGFGFLWLGAALYFLGTIIAVILSAAMHKRQTMAGILVGISIGIVSLGGTCFTMISTGSYI
jgi:hypothetical protein